MIARSKWHHECFSIHPQTTFDPSKLAAFVLVLKTCLAHVVMWRWAPLLAAADLIDTTLQEDGSEGLSRGFAIFQPGLPEGVFERSKIQWLVLENMFLLKNRKQSKMFARVLGV